MAWPTAAAVPPIAFPPEEARPPMMLPVPCMIPEPMALVPIEKDDNGKFADFFLQY